MTSRLRATSPHRASLPAPSARLRSCREIGKARLGLCIQGKGVPRDLLLYATSVFRQLHRWSQGVALFSSFSVLQVSSGSDPSRLVAFCLPRHAPLHCCVPQIRLVPLPLRPGATNTMADASVPIALGDQDQLPLRYVLVSAGVKKNWALPAIFRKTRTRRRLATNGVIDGIQRLRTEPSPGEHPSLVYTQSPRFPQRNPSKCKLSVAFLDSAD